MANGLTYQEVEAFERGNLLRLTVWERHLLRRLDTAVVDALNSRIGKPKSKQAENAIPVTQPGRLIDSIRSRIAAQNERKRTDARSRPPGPPGSE